MKLSLSCLIISSLISISAVGQQDPFKQVPMDEIVQNSSEQASNPEQANTVLQNSTTDETPKTVKFGEREIDSRVIAELEKEFENDPNLSPYETKLIYRQILEKQGKTVSDSDLMDMAQKIKNEHAKAITEMSISISSEGKTEAVIVSTDSDNRDETTIIETNSSAEQKTTETTEKNNIPSVRIIRFNKPKPEEKKEPKRLGVKSYNINPDNFY